MSVVYTCVQVSSGSAPIVFQERNLRSSTAAKIDDCGIHIIPTRQLTNSFVLLSNNLQHYAKAWDDESAVLCNIPFRNVLKDLQVVDVTSPVVAVNYNAETEDEVDMMNRNGMVAAPGDRKNIWIGSPTLEAVRLLGQAGVPLNNPTPAGNTPLSGALAFYYGWKAIALASVFFEGHGNQRSWFMGEEVTEGKAEDGFKRKGIVEGDEKQIAKIDSEDDIEIAGMKTVSIEGLRLVAVVGGNGYIASDKTFVGLSYRVASKGIVFPYFDGLLEPSREFAVGVFFRYFSKSFCDTLEEMSSMAPILRQGFRLLAVSNAGRALSHAMFGVQGALEAGARLKIIVDNGRYKGFILMGDFAVINKGSILYPAPKEEVNGSIILLDEHSTSLSMIADKLSGIALRMGGVRAVTKEEISTSRKLAYQFQIRSIITGDGVDFSFKSAVEKLQFGEKFWDITIESTSLCIRAMMRNGDLEGPFHATWENLISQDPIRRALAVYGPMAPTVCGGSQKIPISPPGREDQNLVEVEGSQRMRYIPVYKKAIVTAVNDWRSLQNAHMMSIFPAKKRGAKIPGYSDRSKDICIADGVRRNTFYELLREFSYDNQVVAAGSKRKAIGLNEGDSGSGSGSKKSKGKGKERSKAMDFF